MVEAVAEDHVHVGVGPAVGDVSSVDTLGPKLVGVGDTGALEPLHGKHPSSGVLEVRLRRHDPTILLEVPVEGLEVAGLAAEIELEEQLFLEVGDVLDWLVEAQLGAVLLGQLGQRTEDLQIVGDFPLDLGAEL